MPLVLPPPSSSVVLQNIHCRAARNLTELAQTVNPARLAPGRRQLLNDLTGIRKVLVAAILTPSVATTTSRSVGFDMSDGKSGTFTISITGHITLTDDDVRRLLAEAMPQNNVQASKLTKIPEESLRLAFTLKETAEILGISYMTAFRLVVGL
jgi:hypothetical protein